MNRGFRAAGAVLLASAIGFAGCTAPPPADPELLAMQEIDVAHRPLMACVQAEMGKRADFAGGLPGIIVDAGMAADVQALRRKYLSGHQDLEGLPREAQVAATQSALLALGTYGGGAAAPGESDRMRRMMAMVESTSTIAAATGIDCEPSDTLIRLMNKAENEYL